MRLIDADALTDELIKGSEAYTDKSIQTSLAKSVCMIICKAIEQQSTVDPFKHGHWIEVQRLHETDHTAICECSLCGDTVWVYDGQRAWNYCPRCGAKMDEVTDEID